MDQLIIPTNDSPGSDVMTAAQFKEAMPPQIRGRVTADVMRGINEAIATSEARENFRENLLSYTNVLQAGRYKIAGYIDAVKYVSYKLMGYTNQDAWGKTFPNRLSTLIAEGADDKTISSYVAAFNRSKLVNAIWEQTLIPSYVLNADKFQDAINRQAWLMEHSLSEKVQTDAANSLLNHLKQPEVAKIQLDVAVTEDKSIQELRASTAALAAQQKILIEKGLMSAGQIAHTTLEVLPVQN